jgi:IPTL-CTERM motif
MRNRNSIVQSQSSAAISQGTCTFSCSQIMATLAACWLFASPALAGGGIAGGCPTNQPCIELVAVAINGTPITPTSNVTVQPGDEIETNLFISGWGDTIGLLRGYAINISWPSSAESGTRGTVLPLGLDEPNGDPQRAAQIDNTRVDYVFFGKRILSEDAFTAPTSSTYRFEAAVRDNSDRVADDGVPRYAGTFRLVVSTFACGEFAYDEFSLAVLSNGQNFTVATSVPFRLNVGACDCNANGLDDLAEIASGTTTDCDGNGVPDECEPDCQPNGIPDGCDILDGTSLDCDLDLIPDECESATDCNNNGIRDECEVVGPGANDCNGNGIPDDCDGGSDCNGNGLLDSCDLANDTSIDCQPNGVPDECDIASGTSTDNDSNGVPDECETYCALSSCGPGSCLSLKAVAINGNPIEPTNNVTASRGDVIETEVWLSCWGADIGLLRAYEATLDGPDAVVSGDAGLVLPVGWDAPIEFAGCYFDFDCPLGTICFQGRCIGPNHFPELGIWIDTDDEDYVLRNFNQVADFGTSELYYKFLAFVFGSTGAADSGEPKYGGTLLLSVSEDACGEFTFDFFVNRGNPDVSETVFLAPDSITLAAPNTQPLFIQTHDCDCNNNGVLDDEELATGSATDCNNNNLPDDCDPDCNLNGTPDDCELANCNGDRSCGDCNENGIPDSCDIASGTSPDADGNGTPDDCFMAIPTVSEWGLAVLAILLLVAAKLKFGFFEVRRSTHA